MGYPAHWISGVLDNICSGKITTVARPPRSDLLSSEETNTAFEHLVQSTAPFVAEMTTLLSMWQPTLPFGIISRHIPPVQEVHQYSFTFKEVPNLAGEFPAFILMLFSLSLFTTEFDFSRLRRFMLSEEKASKKKKVRVAWQEGIHVLSTWRWDRQRKKATFWLRKDVCDKLDRREWGISIWRTDTWMRHAGPWELWEGLVDEGPWIGKGSQ